MGFADGRVGMYILVVVGVVVEVVIVIVGVGF